MKITSVRFRLLLWNIGILAVALLGFHYLSQLTIRTLLIRGMDRRAGEMAARALSFYANPPENAPPVPKNVPPPPEDKRRPEPFRAFDLQGKVLPHPGPQSSTPITIWDTAAFARAAAGQTVYTFVRDPDNNDILTRVMSRPILRRGQRVGVLQVGMPFEEMQSLLSSLSTVFLILAPCALVLAALGGIFLTDRALRPVRNIVYAADGITSADLSRRLPVTGADEFSQLATTMNGMLARIEKAFTELSGALERERRFTADASHELRTPLTAITANASLALDGDTSPEEYREAMQAIHSAAAMMRRLVDDLLLLARSDSGQLAIDADEVDVEDLFTLATAMVGDSENRAPVQVDIAEDARLLHGDVNHLQRALINMLENARRHTPSSGAIVMAARRDGEMLVLEVADNGEGIPPEALPRLGERFARVDAARSRAHGGTGLGLAICRGIAEAHCGQFSIESKPGIGTRVQIRLPLSPREAGETKCALPAGH